MLVTTHHSENDLFDDLQDLMREVFTTSDARSVIRREQVTTENRIQFGFNSWTAARVVSKTVVA